MRRRRDFVRRDGQREHGVLHEKAAFPQQLPAQLQGRPLLVRAQDGGAAGRKTERDTRSQRLGVRGPDEGGDRLVVLARRDLRKNRLARTSHFCVGFQRMRSISSGGGITLPFVWAAVQSGAVKKKKR